MVSCPLPLAAQVTHRPLRGVVPKANSLKTSQQRSLLGSKITVHCASSALRARADRRVSCRASTAELSESASLDASKVEDAKLEDIVLDFSPDAPYAEKMLKIGEFFERNAGPEMALRLAEVLSVFTRCASLWKWEELRGIPLEKRKRATRLKDGIAQLGPVFVKLAQTLSTRPDIVGEEAADKLLLLQDQMGPFESDIAYETIRSELGWSGPVVPGEDGAGPDVAALFAELSPEPIAAASIGQVYRGVLNEPDPETGLPAEVAVKREAPTFQFLQCLFGRPPLSVTASHSSSAPRSGACTNLWSSAIKARGELGGLEKLSF
ncbi:hypothetical protein CYMTET_49642 [Cymbomonas tetramitiformis]|uniref:ABC1 atypical kinase-like domain-containing protein n=1 Tax=Cymbomonas tetramitiformis TaxID=36881 RepID=A0AAE0BPR4_9CHLO|nr:hypothetical protein CYMTET_49642 [Cymbomonas tetramitiformis]